MYVVDLMGHIVAYPDTKTFFPGTDVSKESPVVAQIRALPRDFFYTETMRFTLKENGHDVPMMGAYTTMPGRNFSTQP